MASAPQMNLPLFYKDLLPLNSRDHKSWKCKTFDSAAFIAETHAVPVTIDEFVDAQRSYPIVFTAGENPLPIAMMGMNEGVNVFIDDEGKFIEQVYIPAYARRYPFILARLRQDSEDMSLCFDPASEVVGDFKDGQELFDSEGQPSEYTKGVLDFCEKFEQAGQRTKAFMEELEKRELLMDGEIAITQNDDKDKPFIYRGFRMVDEKKLAALPDDQILELHKNGMLVLIHAHLFSLNLMRSVFGRQVQQGKMPKPDAATQNANASAN
ncbi:SapC family protein [Altererythrobacter lutimaris]|uniref:SapC family protein n=1 Tax=Altererythrobacter lutimaris TaxID=2743979 RepID=A0A850H9A4_9SPHN|nr:SapC family protein [Altererythrobacter lutimaris]NVE94080.1 SapC family protein [Altererythrobacter lutimaris]